MGGRESRERKWEGRKCGGKGGESEGREFKGLGRTNREKGRMGNRSKAR